MSTSERRRARSASDLLSVISMPDSTRTPSASSSLEGSRQTATTLSPRSRYCSFESSYELPSELYGPHIPRVTTGLPALSCSAVVNQPLPRIPEEIAATVVSRRGAIDLVASRNPSALHIHADDEGPVAFHGCIQSPAGGGKAVELPGPKPGPAYRQFNNPEIAFSAGRRFDRRHRQRPGASRQFQALQRGETCGHREAWNAQRIAQRAHRAGALGQRICVFLIDDLGERFGIFAVRIGEQHRRPPDLVGNSGACPGDIFGNPAQPFVP